MPVTQRATQIVHGSSLDPDFETTDEHEAHGHHTALYFEDWIRAYLITHRRFRTDEGRATEQDNLSHFLKFYEAMRSSVGPVVSPDGSECEFTAGVQISGDVSGAKLPSVIDAIKEQDRYGVDRIADELADSIATQA